ncbi:MAG: hypothetical protein ABIP61_12320 [Burkholderiaceae bacterium]
MTATLDHRRLWSLDGLPGAEGSALIAAARALRRGAASGANASLLRGRQIALLNDPDRANVAPCSDDPDATGALLCGASRALGASVTRLQHRGNSADRARDLPGFARLMGRLYDAIDCGDLASDVAREIERAAGVPVFNGLSGPRHPARLLAERMADEETAALPMRLADAAPPHFAISNQCYVVQAILLATLG